LRTAGADTEHAGAAAVCGEIATDACMSRHNFSIKNLILPMNLVVWIWVFYLFLSFVIFF